MTEETEKHQMRFQRANYVVADIERALTLYRDALGFELAFVKQSDGSSYSYDVFRIDQSAKLRLAVLGLPNQPNILALTEVAGVNLPPVAAPNRAAIVLECQNLDAVCHAVTALGLTLFPEDQLVTKDGRTGREVGFYDFDGNLIVLYKILTYPSG